MSITDSTVKGIAMQMINSAIAAGVRVPKILRAVLVGCLAIVASANASATTYVFTTADCPGAVGTTQAMAFNSAGTIVGNYGAAGVSYVGVRQPDGTLMCTPLPAAPGGMVLIPRGINDSGTIVFEADAPDHSYSIGLLLNGTTYTSFSHPLHRYTYPGGINSAGVVVGQTTDIDENLGPTPNAGFIYDPGSGMFTDITVPGGYVIFVRGINTAGQVVGSLRIPATGLGTLSFLRDPASGLLSYFQIIPYQNTRARAINTAGLIAGFTADPVTGTQAAFVGTPSSGYQILHSPGFDPTTTDTIAFGINDSGQILGNTFPLDGTVQSFIAVPDAATQITNLIASLQGLNLQQGGTSNSLTSKLQNALNGLGSGTPSACNQLNAFINQTQALSGNQLTTAQADLLIASANQIKTAAGCP